MRNVINNEKLEQLLTKNWAEFIDYRKLIAFIMICVRDNKDTFPIHKELDLPKKNVEITISKFSIKRDKFLLWIDFTVPQESGFSIGTCEAYLTNLGELILNQVVGQTLIQYSR